MINLIKKFIIINESGVFVFLPQCRFVKQNLSPEGHVRQPNPNL